MFRRDSQTTVSDCNGTKSSACNDVNHGRHGMARLSSLNLSCQTRAGQKVGVKRRVSPQSRTVTMRKNTAATVIIAEFTTAALPTISCARQGFSDDVLRWEILLQI